MKMQNKIYKNQLKLFGHSFTILTISTILTTSLILTHLLYPSPTLAQTRAAEHLEHAEVIELEAMITDLTGRAMPLPEKMALMEMTLQKYRLAAKTYPLSDSIRARLTTFLTDPAHGFIANNENAMATVALLDKHKSLLNSYLMSAVAGELQKTLLPELSHYGRLIPRELYDGVNEGMQFTANAAEIILNHEHKVLLDQGTHLSYQVTALADIAGTLATIKDLGSTIRNISFVTITNPKRDGTGHFMPINIVLGPDGKYIVSIFNSTGKGFQGMSDSALFSTIKAILGEDTVVYSMESPRQRDGYNCTVFSMEDLIAASYMSYDDFKFLKSFYPSEKIYVDTDFPVIQLKAIPAEFMKLAQSIGQIQKFIDGQKELLGETPKVHDRTVEGGAVKGLDEYLEEHSEIGLDLADDEAQAYQSAQLDRADGSAAADTKHIDIIKQKKKNVAANLSNTRFLGILLNTLLKH